MSKPCFCGTLSIIWRKKRYHFCQAVLILRWCLTIFFFLTLFFVIKLGGLGGFVMLLGLLCYLFPSSWWSAALTVFIQRTNECARFSQVVCEPVPMFYQQACWMAGQMAPNDVTSCFNKTLEGRAASLNSNKDYYAIHFPSSPCNSLSLSGIVSLPLHLQPTSQRLCSMYGNFSVSMWGGGTHAFMSNVFKSHTNKLWLFSKWDS